jgi:hypothetical protein
VKGNIKKKSQRYNKTGWEYIPSVLNDVGEMHQKEYIQRNYEKK